MKKPLKYFRVPRKINCRTNVKKYVTNRNSQLRLKTLSATCALFRRMLINILYLCSDIFFLQILAGISIYMTLPKIDISHHFGKVAVYKDRRRNFAHFADAEHVFQGAVSRTFRYSGPGLLSSRDSWLMFQDSSQVWKENAAFCQELHTRIQ